MFSLLINMSADGLKDWKEKCDSKQQADLEAKRAEIQQNITAQLQVELKRTESINERLVVQQKQLERTANTTSSILKESRRASDLFSLNDVDSFTFAFSFSINDPFVKAYRKRAMKTKFPGSKEDELFTDHYLITTRRGDDLWPQEKIASEAVLARAVSTDFLVVEFMKSHEATYSLVADFDCSPEESDLVYRMPNRWESYIGREELTFYCSGSGADIKVVDNDRTYKTSQDFNGAVVSVSAPSAAQNAKFDYPLDWINFKTKSGLTFRSKSVANCREDKKSIAPIGTYSQLCVTTLRLD